MEYSKLVEQIVEEIDSLKGEDLVVLDLRKLENAVTSFFVICTANSTTHAEGIAGAIAKGVSRELKEKPWHKEETPDRGWILLDYVTTVVHIFLRDKREYYNIEDLWADADRQDFNQD